MVEPLSRPLLEEQTVLADRFRLTRQLSAESEASWLAHDEVLDREVVVMALPARESRGRELVQEAGQAGAVTHSGLARVYDAAYESRPPRPRVAYVVREWIDGQRLTQLLAEGPVRPARALELATQATEALSALHTARVGHGRLHPGNVVVDGAGRLHLTDAGIAAVRADGDVAEATDLRDIGALLYALTTARWPASATDQPARGLLPAPAGDRGVMAPRQVRAGVPAALDTLVMRLLEPSSRPGSTAILTAPALLKALQQAADAVGREEQDALPPEPRPPGRLRKALPLAAVLAGLVVLATCSYSVGQSVGEVRGEEDSVASPEDEAVDTPTGAAVERAIDLNASPVSIRDFDPSGVPRRENPSAVGNAYDREASTVWDTELYKTADFGGLPKDGVGLLVDLGRPTALTRVLLDVTVPGTRMELLASNTLGATELAYTTVAQSTANRAGTTLTLTPPSGLTRRYYVVWITTLARDGSQFRTGIKEMSFRRR